MKDPFFSVVTPSWHQASWIEGNIKSVLIQSVPDFEHIIFDNCSSDGTAEILARYPHLDVHIEADNGQSEALNKGFRAARGEIICWLNSDDEYLPGTFERVRREFMKPGVDVVYGDCQEDLCNGLPPCLRKARFPKREDLLVWWEKRTDILQPAVFFRRSIFEEIGLLREDLHLVMDTEFWWRMSAHHPFHYLEVALARQQRQPDSKTIKHMPQIYEEKARVFGPLLDVEQPHRRLQNAISRRRGMSQRWLGLAQSAAARKSLEARDLLFRALAENPLLTLTFCWWKAFACTLKISGRPASRAAED